MALSSELIFEENIVETRSCSFQGFYGILFWVSLFVFFFFCSCVFVLTASTCSPCHAWPTSAWLCARAAAGKSRTDITCWPWTSSGTCAASSAASANSTWSPSSPASAKTAASTAKRTTTGRRARRGSNPGHVIGEYLYYLHLKQHRVWAGEGGGFKNISNSKMCQWNNYFF